MTKYWDVTPTDWNHIELIIGGTAGTENIPDDTRSRVNEILDKYSPTEQPPAWITDDVPANSIFWTQDQDSGHIIKGRPEHHTDEQKPASPKSKGKSKSKK